jgi:hypothetical protein
MKKIFAIVAIFALVMTVFISGCASQTGGGVGSEAEADQVVDDATEQIEDALSALDSIDADLGLE